MSESCDDRESMDTESLHDMAIVANDSMDIIPDTPSPVFDKKHQKSQHASNPAAETSSNQQHSSSHHCSNMLPSQQKHRFTRNGAMNRLKLKREKMKVKKDIIVSDTDDDILLPNQQTSDVLGTAGVSLDSSDSEDGLRPFDVGPSVGVSQLDQESDIDDQELDDLFNGIMGRFDNCAKSTKNNGAKGTENSGAKGAKNNGSRGSENNLVKGTKNNVLHCEKVGSSCSIIQSDDESDIDDEDLDYLLNGIMDEYEQGAGNVSCQNKVKKGGIKRKSDTLKRNSFCKKPRNESLNTIQNSVIVIDDNSINETASPTTILHAVANASNSPNKSESHARTRRNIAHKFDVDSASNSGQNCERTNPADRRSVNQSTRSQNRSRNRVSAAASVASNHTVTSSMLPAPTVESVSSTDSQFVLPSPVGRNSGTRSSSRTGPNARTRSGTLGRRHVNHGNRTASSPGSNWGNSSLLVSPSTRQSHQLAEDEVMARQLQEEMDLEFALSLRDTSSPPTVVAPSSGTMVMPPPRSPNRGRHSTTSRGHGRNSSRRRLPGESDLGYDTHMYMMIGGMTEDQWRLHQATVTGQTGVEPPLTPHTTPDDLMNTEVLDFLNHYQYQRRYNRSQTPQRAVNERSPIRPSARRAGVATRTSSRPTAASRPTPPAASALQTVPDLDYETAMLMRIGGLSENDWEIHRSFLNEGSTANDTLDTEILSFMRFNQNRRSHTSRRGSRRGRRGSRQNDFMANSFDANDYESLLNLAESIGDVKQNGLTEQQITMLPTKSYRGADVKEDGIRECNICMADYEENESLRLLQCFHYFHTKCIDRWLKEKASCPICRVEVKFE